MLLLVSCFLGSARHSSAAPHDGGRWPGHWAVFSFPVAVCLMMTRVPEPKYLAVVGRALGVFAVPVMPLLGLAAASWLPSGEMGATCYADSFVANTYCKWNFWFYSAIFACWAVCTVLLARGEWLAVQNKPLSAHYRQRYIWMACGIIMSSIGVLGIVDTTFHRTSVLVTQPSSRTVSGWFHAYKYAVRNVMYVLAGVIQCSATVREWLYDLVGLRRAAEPTAGAVAVDIASLAGDARGGTANCVRKKAVVPDRNDGSWSTRSCTSASGYRDMPSTALQPPPPPPPPPAVWRYQAGAAQLDTSAAEAASLRAAFAPSSAEGGEDRATRARATVDRLASSSAMSSAPPEFGRPGEYLPPCSGGAASGWSTASEDSAVGPGDADAPQSPVRCGADPGPFTAF